jgi:hypothetical protein
MSLPAITEVGGGLYESPINQGSGRWFIRVPAIREMGGGLYESPRVGGGLYESPSNHGSGRWFIRVSYNVYSVIRIQLCTWTANLQSTVVARC